MAILTLDPKTALNALKFQARDLKFSWEGNACAFEFLPSKPHYDPVVWVKGAVGGMSIEVGLKEWPKLHFEGKPLSQVDLKHLPQSVAIGLIEAAIRPLILSIGESLRQDVVLQSVAFGPASDPLGERLEFMVVDTNSRSQAIDGAIFIRESLLPLFAEAWSALPLKVPSETALPVVPIAFALLGRQTLTLKEFRSLRLQDILLFEEAPDFQGDTLWLSIGSDQVFEAEFQRGQFKLKEPIAFLPFPTSPVMDIERIPLDVHFVLGQKKLSLQELRSMKPGYAFEFPVSLEGPVGLMVNGQVVGRGEVVMVEGRVGVRLIALGHIADEAAKLASQASSSRAAAKPSKATVPPMPVDADDSHEDTDAHDEDWATDDDHESDDDHDDAADEDDDDDAEDDNH
jgi:type III secretion system YscQ/HrcQ family protein